MQPPSSCNGPEEHHLVPGEACLRSAPAHQPDTQQAHCHCGCAALQRHVSTHTAPGGVCCCFCRASWLCWMWGPAAPCMPCCMKAPSHCEQSTRRTLAQQLRTCCCCSNPTAGAAACQQRSSWRPNGGTGFSHSRRWQPAVLTRPACLCRTDGLQVGFAAASWPPCVA